MLDTIGEHFIVNDGTAIRVGSYIGAWNHKEVDRNTILVGSYDGLHLLKRRNGVWKYGFKVEGFDISSRFLEMINDREVLISHAYKGVFHITLSDDFKSVKNVNKLNIEKVDMRV